MKRLTLASLVIGASLLCGRTATAALAHYWNFSTASTSSEETTQTYADQARALFPSIAGSEANNTMDTTYYSGGTATTVTIDGTTGKAIEVVGGGATGASFTTTISNFAADFGQTAGSVSYTIETMVKVTSWGTSNIGFIYGDNEYPSVVNMYGADGTPDITSSGGAISGTSFSSMLNNWCYLVVQGNASTDNLTAWVVPVGYSATAATFSTTPSSTNYYSQTASGYNGNPNGATPFSLGAVEGSGSRQKYDATAYYDGVAIYDDAQTPSQLLFDYQNWFTPTYWTGGGTDANMSTAGNWLYGLPASGSELRFGPLAAGGYTAPNNDVLAWSSSTAAAGIRFLGTSDTTLGSVNSAAYTLTGNSMQITGPINNDSTNNQVIDLGIQFSGGTAGTINTLSNAITFNGVLSSVDATSTVTKTGSGTAIFNATNTYSGNTVISGGALQADDGIGLAGTNLSLSGGVLQGNGQVASFTRALGAGAGQVQWTGNGGFSAANAPLNVLINSGASDPLAWGGTANFVGGGSVLLFGSPTANNVITFQDSIDLNGAARTINVTAGTGGDYAVLSGTLIDSGSNTSGGLNETGNGTLVLTATNTYAGPTTILGGALEAIDGVGLPGTNLVLDGGVFQGHYDSVLNPTPTFTRSLGAGAGQVQWSTTGGGGFSARDAELTVNLGGGSAALQWGATPNFVQTGQALLFGSNTANAETLFQNPIDLNGAAQTVQVTAGAGGDYAVLAGVLSDIGGLGTGGLTKTGNGLLVLSNTNTYGGASSVTTIGGGALQADDGIGLPSATNLTLQGGVLQGNGTMTLFDRPLGIGSGSVQWTSSGGFSAGAGTPLTVDIGAGASDPLQWGVTTNFIPNGSALLFGSLTADNVVNFENSIDLSGAMRTIQVTAGTGGDYALLSGNLIDSSGTGGGGLVETGNGVLDLTGANTYTGGMTLNGGVLTLGSSSAIGPSGIITFGGGTLQFTASNTTDYSSRFNTAVNQAYNLDTNSQDVTLASNLTSNGGTLTKIGAGTLTVDGSNTYTGGTSINGGVLSLGSAAAIGATGTISFGGGTLQYSAANQTDYSPRFSTAAGQAVSVDTNGQDVTFAAALTSPSGSLTVNDTSGTPGMLVLAAPATYSGGTTINGGEIKLNGIAGELPSLASSASNGRGGALTMNAGTLDLEGTAQTVGALSGGTGALISDEEGDSGITPLTVSFDSGASTFAGQIADGPNSGLSLTKSGSGTLILSGNDAYSGGTVIDAGTLALTTNTALPAGSNLTINAGAALVFDPSFAAAPVSLARGETVAAAPEPGTLALLLAGAGLGLGAWRKRRARR